MKRNILIKILLCTLGFALNAQTKISADAEQYLSKFFSFRVELTQYQNDKAKAIAELNKFRVNNPYDNFSTQEKLIIESFLLSEDYNYMYDDKSNDAAMKKKLSTQIDKCEAYMKANKGNLSEWFYLGMSDCLSCFMGYSPVSGAIKYGMKVKEYYEAALAINPKNSMTLTHYAQWFYWAPVINGGGKKKSKTHLESALACATTDADKFYANVYYSQICFDLGDKTAAKTYLEKAKAIFPKSEFITELENANAAGLSIFESNKKRAETSKRMD